MNKIEHLFPKDIYKEILTSQDKWENEEYFSQNFKRIQECILTNINWLYNQDSRVLIQNFFIQKYPENFKFVYKKFLIYFNKVCNSIILNNQSNFQDSYEKLKKIFEIIIEFNEKPIYYYNIKLQYLKNEEKTYKELLKNGFWFYDRPYRSYNTTFGYSFDEGRVHNENGKIVFEHRFGHSFLPKNADCIIKIKLIENDVDYIKHNNIYLSILPFDDLVIKDDKDHEFFKEEYNFTLNELKVNWDNVSSDSMEIIQSFINSLQLIKDSYFEVYYNVNLSIANLIDNLNKNNVSVENLLNKSKLLKIKKYSDDYFNFDLKDINIFIGKNNTGKTFALNRLYSNPEKYKFIPETINEIHINHNFIPNFRYLDNSLGSYNNLVDMIIKLLISIFFLQNQEFLSYNLNFDKSRLKMKFPNFNFDLKNIEYDQ